MSDPNTTNKSPSDTQPQYEFNAAQNEIINQLARAIMWVRAPLLVAGICQVIIALGLSFRLERDGAHIVGVLGHALSSIVCFMLSSWLLRAASAFMLVTTTTGRDVSHMMTALRNLGAWFDLLAFFVKLYVALLGLLLAVLMFGLLFGTFRESTGQ